MTKLNHGASFNPDTGLWTIISLDIAHLIDIPADDKFLNNPFEAGYMRGDQYIELPPTLDTLAPGETPPGIPADIVAQTEALAKQYGQEVTVKEYIPEPDPFYTLIKDETLFGEPETRYEFIDADGNVIGYQEPGGEFVEAAPKVETLNFKVNADGSVDTSEMNRNQLALFEEYKDTDVFQKSIEEAQLAAQANGGEAVNVQYVPATMDHDWGYGQVGILASPAKVTISQQDGTVISNKSFFISAKDELDYDRFKDWEDKILPMMPSFNDGAEKVSFTVDKDGNIAVLDENGDPVSDVDQIRILSDYVDDENFQDLINKAQLEALKDGGNSVSVTINQPAQTGWGLKSPDRMLTPTVTMQRQDGTQIPQDEVPQLGKKGFDIGDIDILKRQIEGHAGDFLKPASYTDPAITEPHIGQLTPGFFDKSWQPYTADQPTTSVGYSDAAANWGTTQAVTGQELDFTLETTMKI